MLCELDYNNFSRVLSDRSLNIHKEIVPNFERAIFSRFQEHRKYNGAPHGHDNRHNGTPQRYGQQNRPQHRNFERKRYN